ncbi:MAG: fatty acid desaturase [Fuerstiella sp.]
MEKYLWPRFLAFPLFAVAGQWFWMQHYSPLSPAACAFWIPVLTYCWFCVGGLSHELIHQNLPFGPRASRVIGRIIGTAIIIPYSVYREVHMRHHAYLNTPLDWELWPYSDPQASLRFRRIFVWFDMLAGILATPLIWSRICFSSKSPVSKHVRRVMLKEYVAIAVALIAAVATGVWLIASGRYQFRPASLIFAVPPVLAASCNSVRKLMEHVGTRSFDPLHGTRTVIGRSVLTRLLSYFDFDLAVHGPHHRYPKLDHSLLKSRMAEVRKESPDVSFPVFQSFTAALLDTFRTAITNPGVGVNAGCTDDLSHLPGLRDSAPPRNGLHIVFATKAVKIES